MNNLAKASLKPVLRALAQDKLSEWSCIIYNFFNYINNKVYLVKTVQLFLSNVVVGLGQCNGIYINCLLQPSPPLQQEDINLPRWSISGVSQLKSLMKCGPFVILTVIGSFCDEWTESR